MRFINMILMISSDICLGFMFVYSNTSYSFAHKPKFHTACECTLIMINLVTLMVIHSIAIPPGL